MPIDSLLELVDGSVAYTAATDTPATSTTRDAATGAAVIDLGPGTGMKGLVAVLYMPDDADGATDTLTAFIEVSSVVNFASDVSEVGKFDVAAATKGVIVGSEMPTTAMLKFMTDKRYVRLNGTVGASPDSFGNVRCWLNPHAYKNSI